MNGTHLGIMLVCFGLVVFGYFYNQFVDWAERKGYTEGYLSFIVALGVAVTIAGTGFLDLFLDWNSGLIALAAFACSGTPMVAGSVWRYVEARAREQERQRDEGKAVAE